MYRSSETLGPRHSKAHSEGWAYNRVATVNGGPGLGVIVNQNTSAKWINWERVARDGVYPMTVSGKPICYGMPATAELKGFKLGMD